MADFQFYVDIEDSSGNKLGSGPLASARRWRYTARFDRAGSIEFTFAANDPQASIVENRRVARAHALLNGVWTEVGAGVIDEIETVPGDDGIVILRASGMDLIRELSYRNVGTLEIGAGSGTTHAAALTAISALAPVGWTFTPSVSPDNDYIYARYGGESVLGALVHLAERTQTHFYRSTNRTLVFSSLFTDSGVRAIQAFGDLAAETCAITRLRRTVDTHDLLTRITPYGSGNGEARLTLAATSRSAPVGYTLSAANNYIENDSATTSYGLIDHPEIEFKEIGPISNTDADLTAAADMLFDAALEELQRRSSLASQETYDLSLANCSQLLRPLQTIRLVYRDVDQGININDDLYILAATWELDESSIRTSQLTVSTDDLWPVSDVVASAERAVEGRVFQAHPQLNANSYVTAYTKNVDETNTAAFRFRFGSEVVSLQQVLFEFQILPFESTVKSIASDSPTTSSGGSSTPSASSGGSQTPTSGGGGGTTVSSSSGGSATPTSSSGGGTTVSSSSGGSATPTSGNGGGTTVSSTSGGSSTPTSGNGGGTTVSSSSGGSATPTSSSGGSSSPTSSSGGSFSGSSGLITDGGTIITSEGSVDAFYDGVASSDIVVSTGIPGAPGSFDHSHTHWVYMGEHWHKQNYMPHTHAITISAHTHTVSISAHDHTVTIAAHTHNVTLTDHNHTVTIAAHTHGVTLTDHNHTVNIAAHTHDVTLSNHDHTVTISAHTHDVTLTNHTHTVAITAHTHDVTIAAHTHTVAPIITTVYGIFRQTAPNTYAITDLDYRVNSGTWFNMEDDAISAGDGWYELDLTSLLMNSTTFRPLATNNLLEIRSLTASKTATIDAQLSVRNIIQAIAYA